MQTPELSLTGYLHSSFERYLQQNTQSDRREGHGLERAFRSVFPVLSNDGIGSLEYISYSPEPPKYSAEECIPRGMTYASPIKVVIRLVEFEPEEDRRTIRSIKEQEVYFGEIPLMTSRGTFIIEGEERYIPNQLQRCPGVFFSRTTAGEPRAELTSSYGLRASITKTEGGFSVELFIPEALELSAVFRSTPRTILLSPDEDSVFVSFEDVHLGRVVSVDQHAPNGELILPAKTKLTASALKKLRASGARGMALSTMEALALFATEDIYSDGSLLLGAGQAVVGAIDALKRRGIFSVRTVSLGDRPTPPLSARLADEAALLQWFSSTFICFELDLVGRIVLNNKLSSVVSLEQTNLQPEDLSKIVERLDAMLRGAADVDEVSHLGELQLLSAGELLARQSLFGLLRMEQKLKERLENAEIEILLPHDLINAKPLVMTLKKFFEAESIALDKTNPFTVLRQLRRVEVPQGFSAHPTHKDRLLHQELALYCRPNELSFLEAPYTFLEDGQLRGVRYLSAHEAARYTQDGAVFSPYRELPDEISTKKISRPKHTELVEVSPLQGSSLSNALCANEAAARYYAAASPLYESTPRGDNLVAACLLRESGSLLTAKRAGVVVEILSDRIWVETDSPDELLPDEHLLRGLLAAVDKGQRVEAGAPLAYDLSGRAGSLSLGRMCKVGFACEASGAVASSRMKQALSCRRMLSLECTLYDTEDGPEFITRDLPGIDPASLAHLGEDGIVREGAEVRAGDILVGKRTPTKSGDKSLPLSAPACSNAVVKEVHVFSRASELSASRREAKSQLANQLAEMKRGVIRQKAMRSLLSLLRGAEVGARLMDDKGRILLVKGAALTEEALQQIPQRHLFELELVNPELQQGLAQIYQQVDSANEQVYHEINSRHLVDELPRGVVAIVRVLMECRRELVVGDTLADQAGNCWEVSGFFDDAREYELLLPSKTAQGESDIYLMKISTES